jgi:hypothetical protein
MMIRRRRGGSDNDDYVYVYADLSLCGIYMTKDNLEVLLVAIACIYIGQCVCVCVDA